MSARERRLQRQLDDLQTRSDRLYEKMKMLTDDYDKETRTEEKLRLQSIINETKKEMEEVDNETDNLEVELKQLQAPVETPAAPSSAPAATSSTHQNTGSAASSAPVKVFYSYAHKDEDLRDKLNTHLKILVRQEIISEWYDRDIEPGDQWADDIDDNLDSAQIILLLVSADFIASDYCWGKEMTRAMEKHAAGEARVVPIILRECDWNGVPFAKLQALPKNAKPVTSFGNQDAAFTDIARGIRRVAEGMRKP